MKKKLIIIISLVAIIAIVLGVFLSIKNKNLEKNSIKIIDATYSCNQSREKFYEDDNYVYYFPCIKSTSIFVKFPNGNKILVVKALEDNKVTIDELIKAGLEVIKEDK